MFLHTTLSYQKEACISSTFLLFPQFQSCGLAKGWADSEVQLLILRGPAASPTLYLIVFLWIEGRGIVSSSKITKSFMLGRKAINSGSKHFGVLDLVLPLSV